MQQKYFKTDPTGVTTVNSVPTASLVSNNSVCVWIPTFPLRAEERRRPELVGKPTALLELGKTKQLSHVSSYAKRFGVKAGMSVGQAIGLCPPLILVESDPVYYDETFNRLIHRLTRVTPVIEPDELGRVYMGVDGTERLIGSPKDVIRRIDKNLLSVWFGKPNTKRSSKRRWNKPDIALQQQQFTERHRPWRLGWADGKFASWVAASKSPAGQFLIVDKTIQQEFLLKQRIRVLPLNADTHQRLWQLGLKTLRDVTSLPRQSFQIQFGKEGVKLWDLASGTHREPVIGKENPEPIVESIHLATPLSDRSLIANAIERLIERALRNPRRAGWRVRTLQVRAELEYGASWSLNANVKDPSATTAHLLAPLMVKLDRTPPAGGLTEITVALTAFTPGTKELQLFARDSVSSARAGRRRALRWAVREIRTRLSKPMIHHIIEIHPWSRIPERRYALIDFDP